MRAELLGRELLEVLLVSPTLVVLEVARVAVLQGGEALDAVRVAEGLALGRAVDVGD